MGVAPKVSLIFFSLPPQAVEPLDRSSFSMASLCGAQLGSRVVLLPLETTRFVGLIFSWFRGAAVSGLICSRHKGVHSCGSLIVAQVLQHQQ
jgi:hypothetical protein